MGERSTDQRPYPALVARDAYDEAAFGRAVAHSATLAERIDSGLKLHPGFGALAQDVFTLFFKYTTVLHETPQEEAQGRLELARRVLGWVRTAEGFEQLRAETVLDEARATYGTHLVLEHVLRTLRKPELFSHEDLLGDFQIEALEEKLETLDEQLESARELMENPQEPPAQEALEDAQESLQDERGELKKALDRLRKAQQRRLDDLPASLESQLRELTQALPERMERSEQEVNDFGRMLGVGMDAGMPAATKLELGQQLLHNDKLRKLARLVGAFREFARALRRARFERRPSELHEINRGRDLARLLPVELSQLRHPQLRRVFMQRYAEGRLLQYAIEGNDRGNRGPMVVCLDGSGSMSGDKELWAKAVCLTLLEIARRQKRHFRAVVFSGGRQDMRVFDLLEMPTAGRLEAPPVDVKDLVDFARYFPAGGTDFEGPLSRALDILQEKNLRRGDIVFITDGQAHVSDKWLDTFLKEKNRLDFKVFGVLVDVGNRSGLQPGVMERFCDRLTSVSRLTAKDAGDIFTEV